MKAEIIKKKILEALEESNTISEVTEKTGLSRKIVYKHLDEKSF